MTGSTSALPDSPDPVGVSSPVTLPSGVGAFYPSIYTCITTVNDKGEVIGQKKVPSNGKVVDVLKEFSDSMEIGIKATPNWCWLHDRLGGRGFKARLSHPLETKTVTYVKVKTDRVDSATLTHLLRSDLLPLSYVPKRPMRLNRELLGYRASLIKLQTGVKNKIHTVLAKDNISHD